MLSRDQLNFGSPCQYSQQETDDLEINGPNSIFPLRLSNKCNGQIIQKTCNIWTLFTIKTIIRISIYIILYYSELWFVFYNHFFDDNHVLLRTYLKWKEVNKAAKISEFFRKSEKKFKRSCQVTFMSNFESKSVWKHHNLYLIIPSKWVTYLQWTQKMSTRHLILEIGDRGLKIFWPGILIFGGDCRNTIQNFFSPSYVAKSNISWM